jgi:RHS repeat-associated protein
MINRHLDLFKAVLASGPVSGRKSTCLLLFAFAGLLGAQNLPPATGACQGCTVDTNWIITKNDNGVGGLTGGPAIIVSSLASGWATALTGTQWIAPAANQNLPSSGFTCCVGSTTYRVSFNVTNPATEGFNISLYSDNFATITLNASTSNPTPINYTLIQEYATLAPPIPVKNGFIAGTNTLDFIVFNQGGATGLDVSFVAAPNVVSSSNSAPSPQGQAAAPDPVDGATGQFYDRIVDFALGGPMGLGFARYYSSALPATGVASGLGVSWMSSFDVGLSVSGTTAKALLFGGRLVTFAGSGAVWQAVSPLDPVYQLVQSGTSFKLMDPSNSFIYSFSAAGILTRIEDRNGNAVTITSGPFGPTAAADGLGRTLTFTYTNGNLTKVTDQAARAVTFNYNGNLLVSSIDIYKQTTSYTYTSAGASNALMTKKQLPLGNVPTTQVYDTSGRVVTQTDPNNYVTKIAYDGNGGTTITDPLGNVTRQGNDSNGDLTQLTDPNGAAAFLTFDSSNRRTSFTDKLGNRTTYTYDQPSGRLASVTDALGNTTSYIYTSRTQSGFTFYSLSNISYPDGTSSSYIYDSNGNVLSLTAQDGTTTAYVYDSNGRITSLTAANTKISTYTWNTDSTMATATDPLANVTSFTYDNLKRVTLITDPNGGKTGYVYDQSTTGPMLATGLPGGGGTTIYDDQNRQIQDEVNANGEVFHSDYTATRNISAFTDPLKNKTAYSYDADDRLSSVTSPAGEIVSYAYDAANRVASVSDANGPQVSYTYTSEGNIATSTDGSGGKTSYIYNALGLLTTATTPGGNKYATAYDKLGRVSSLTNPLGEVETLARDPEGRVTSVTRPGAIATTLKRDAEGRITSLTSPNGNAWTIGYDALERPSVITDPLGQATSLKYTGTFLTGATLPLGTLAITSDLNGRITKRQYSDGTAVNVAYDGNGFISSADGFTVKRDGKGQPTNINGIGIALDPASRPAVLTYAAGKTITYTYDKGGRLASVADWVGGKTTLAYDGASRLASLTYPNGVANTFTYDADGRVIKIAVGSIASITLTRDADGKITSADRNVPRLPVIQSSAQQLTYDAAGQLTSATNDAMGRVTAQNGRKYIWNLASQLTSFADGVNSAAFSYDGLGELSSSTFSGAAQTFVYNYLLAYPALSIVRKGGNDQRYYVYLPDGSLLYSIEAADNTRRFYHFDEMGNTTLLTDDAGGVPDAYGIAPYGEIADHLGTTENPFTWQGKYGVIQEGQGLYYVRNRHYDASAARFISRDAGLSADPRSSEPYAYADGNPLRYIDPFGTDITLPSTSPLPAAQAEAFAQELETNIAKYVFSFLDLTLANFNYYTDLENAIQAHPDLDWDAWSAGKIYNPVLLGGSQGYGKLFDPAGAGGLYSSLEGLYSSLKGGCSKPPCSGAPASANAQPVLPVSPPILTGQLGSAGTASGGSGSQGAAPSLSGGAGSPATAPGSGGGAVSTAPAPGGRTKAPAISPNDPRSPGYCTSHPSDVVHCAIQGS